MGSIPVERGGGHNCPEHVCRWKFGVAGACRRCCACLHRAVAPETTHPAPQRKTLEKARVSSIRTLRTTTKNISLCHTILATLKLERRGASESKSESPTNWTTFFHELITIPSPSFFSLPPLLSLSFPLPFLFLSFDGRVRVRVSSIVYKIGGSRFCRSGNAALLEPCSSLVRSLL